MKKFTDLIQERLRDVTEVFPWDLEQMLQEKKGLILLDIREPYEYQAMRIEGSINVPRGILESACDWGYEETVPELAAGRDKAIVVICRSGNRSVLAAYTMQLMGYNKVCSLKTGLRGWNDYEQPLVDGDGEPVEIERADTFFASNVRPEQIGPK